MSVPPPTYHEGPDWSFAFDSHPAPRYVLFTVYGRSTEARMVQMMSALRACYRPTLQLPDGRLCPIVVDCRADELPDPAILHMGRAAVEIDQDLISGLILLIEPGHADYPLMELSFEVMGQFLLPRIATVTTWEAVMMEVERIHQRPLSSGILPGA